MLTAGGKTLYLGFCIETSWDHCAFGRNASKSGQYKTFLAKLKKIITDLINRLRKYFKNVDPDSLAAREFAKIDANAKQILADMFVDMSIDAGEKLSTIKEAGLLDQLNKNTAQEDGVEYKRSVKKTYDTNITAKDIAVLQTIGKISINQFSNQDLTKTQKWAQRFWKDLKEKSPFFRSWFGDWRAHSTSAARIVHFAYGEKGKLNYNKRTVKCVDMNNKEILVDDTVIEDSLHYAKINGDEKQIRKLLGKVDEILNKGILLDTRISDKSSGNKKGSTQFMHYLYTPISINGAPFIAKLSVEEYDVTGKNRAYNLQRIELSALSRAQFAKMITQNREKYAYSADSLTVSQLHEFVKKQDPSFLPKPVNPVFLNEDGTPKKYYHGTNAEWTVYDLSKNVNQMWGEGIYLTPDPKRAALYGDRVMEFYVRAVTDNRTARKTGQKRDYTLMKNGDVLVYSPNQIKSATDNIGTFDGANPNINYKTEVAEDISPRELLLNTVEGMVANSTEWKKLQEYRRKIKELNETEAHLERLNQELKKLYFAEGGRDFEMIIISMVVSFYFGTQHGRKAASDVTQ